MTLQLDGPATESFAAGERQAWVFLLSTETSSHFFLFIIFEVLLIIFTGRVVVIVVAGALARARVRKVDSGAVFGIFDGLGAMSRGTLRRGIFVV
jgi:hypothetical protein